MSNWVGFGPSGGLKSLCALRTNTVERLSPNPIQNSDLLRRRLLWWLIIVLALVLLCLLTFWPYEAQREMRIFAASAVILFALGILVDQMLLSRAIAHDYASTRSALLELNQRLVVEANTDPLTGLYNRRGLESVFQGLISTQQFRYQSIAILMIDLDEFKACNDQYGHPVGDQMLQKTASLMQKALRRSDSIGRWGGDEFCVILPNTGLSQAMLVAKKLCLLMADNPLALEQAGVVHRVSMKTSIGGAAADTAHAFSLDALVAGADTALYQAKAAGGNTAVGVRLD